jgi:hypothetical protein
MLGKEIVGGRQANKWSRVNQRGEPVYLWTDDQLGIALRLEIENVTYEVSGIRQRKIANSMFELPGDYPGRRNRGGKPSGQARTGLMTVRSQPCHGGF